MSISFTNSKYSDNNILGEMNPYRGFIICVLTNRRLDRNLFSGSVPANLNNLTRINEL